MTDESDTPVAAVCAADVESAIRALTARLRETTANSFYTRPLARRDIKLLHRIARHYQALRREDS